MCFNPHINLTHEIFEFFNCRKAIKFPSFSPPVAQALSLIFEGGGEIENKQTSRKVNRR